MNREKMNDANRYSKFQNLAVPQDCRKYTVNYIAKSEIMQTYQSVKKQIEWLQKQSPTSQ